MTTLEIIQDWDTLDGLALLLERLVEVELDEYCDGLGPAPSPVAIAVARRLRSVASERLTSIWNCLWQARANVQVI